jgi:hypothetical protein
MKRGMRRLLSLSEDAAAWPRKGRGVAQSYSDPDPDLQNTPQDVSEQSRGGGLEDLYEVNRSRLLDAPPQMSEQHTPVRKEVASSPSTALTPLKSRRAMIRAKQNLNKKKAPPPLPLGAPVRAHLS